MIRAELRLSEPRWLRLGVPLLSVAVAAVVGAIVLLATGHHPLSTYHRILDAAFTADGALSGTLIAATPLVFCGLAAAAAFRMQLFNIGAEGQLTAGAIGAVAAALALGDAPTWLVIVAMVVAGALAGAAWASIPGLLRAFARTNEIITSLMLNYVAALVGNYLIFDSLSYWRDTSPQGKVFPQGRPLADSASWPALGSSVVVPFGLLLGVAAAAGLWFLYRRTRFGFEVSVLGDSVRAARYAGMRTRRTILAVMALSGALAGIGGASQAGDFAHLFDPRALQQEGFGYTGIVVAALSRYHPATVVVVAFLLGGLKNAGFALQGPDFPSGLIGVLQGLILFCALGGELLARYRIRVGSPEAVAA